LGQARRAREPRCGGDGGRCGVLALALTDGQPSSALTKAGAAAVASIRSKCSAA
jgi:hypothetical protein